MANNKTSGLDKLRKGLKFMSSLVGKLVFEAVKIAAIGLLVYIIASVMLKDIAKLIGEEGGAQSSAGDYEFLRDLTNSGYDAMLNAEELVEYYAFEYAVLMDAARFMEETGTMELHVANGALDFEKLKTDGIDNRKQWAILAAAALRSNMPNEEADALEESLRQENLLKPELQQEDSESADGGGADSEEIGDPNESFGSGKFSTEHTKENLFYRPVYNEFTKERSLVPYLEMTRNYDIVKYYIEYRTGPYANTISSEAESEGINFNLGTRGEKGAGEALDIIDYLVEASRFEYPNNENYQGFGTAWEYIYNHLYPLEIVHELNYANKAAYSDWDPQYNADGGGPVDLYKQYGAGLFYTVQQAPTHHKIPLRILLDRFLPNAVLMSSWRILKDDAATEEDIVDEIQKIYSEACLDGEEASEEVILVKMVNTVSYDIRSETSAKDLFNRPLAETPIETEYLDGKKTNTIYSAYEPLFNSRIWKDEESEEEENEEENNGGLPEEEEEGEGTPASSSQTFDGTFKDDVMDDIKLVLTHYFKDSNMNLAEFAYKQLIDDADMLIEVDKAQPISEEQYVIYTPVENGGYLTNCVLGVGNSEHYNGENHISYANPYAASTEIQQCFVPFMKVAYSQEDGFRMTSVIICYNDEYKGFVVKSKEIKDDAGLSNKKTFVHFESRDISATTARHWQFTTAGEQSEEKWLVEDAFEGLSIGLGDFTLSLKHTLGTATIQLSAESMNLGPDKIQEILNAVTINGQQITDDKNFPGGSLAIVRQFEDDPSRRDYENEPGMLDYPTDASISNEFIAQYWGGNFATTGGESIITDRTFLNLKKYGLQAGQSPNISTAGIDDLYRYFTLDEETAQNLVYIYLYKVSTNTLPVTLADANSASLVARAKEYCYKLPVFPSYQGSYSVTMDNCSEEYAVIFPTRRSIIPIKQDFWDKRIRFYLVKEAKLWSGVKKFNNVITYAGEFADRSNFMYIINKNPDARGLRGYQVTKSVNYRCNLFAPIFAGNDSANTNARETDILLILSEWLEASEQGIHAADHFIRDLNALINYSKGIDYEDGSNVLDPIYNEEGEPYINPGSYTYMYIPDEILKFDDTISEKAFWLDRLICTPEDPIDQEKENFMRSKSETFTWQIVDYALYPECINEDGSARVYPLWMFGNQMSRLLYAIGSNASDKEALKIEAWGGYAPGMHSAADLFSRNMSKKIYADVFREGKERGSVTAEYSFGGVNMEGTNSTEGGSIDIGEYADSTQNAQGEVDIGGGGIYGFGVYDNDSPVTLNLGGKDYTFSGSAAAAYGYELYRQTLILKDGEKAEKLLKERLEQEIEWSEERAVAPGIVTRVEGSEQGFIVEITHAPSASTWDVHTSYWHMKRYPLVQIGQYVGAGTLLGYEGTTGQSGTTHVHLDMNTTNAAQVNPVLYLYPFFTPFYYEEKAEEVNYALDSDYMSTARTVFPYGQPMNAHINDSLAVDQVEVDENGWVKIKNYVPTEVFMEDSRYLYDEDSGYEGFIDYSKLPTSNVFRSLDTVNYDGEILETNPYYFSEIFIRKVMANGYKIEGVELTWDEKTTYEEYDSEEDLEEPSEEEDIVDTDETAENEIQPDSDVSEIE